MSERNKTPLEMFYKWEAECPESIFLRQPIDQHWHDFSWASVADRVRRLAQYLIDQNYPAESRVAIFSANCADWFVADLAIMLAGHISVPLYPGQDVESARYIISHSESKLIFLGKFDFSENASDAIPSEVKRIAIHGCDVEVDDDIESIVSNSSPYECSPVPNLDSTMTIIYTSGTTGNPKGVIHVHGTPGLTIPRMHKAWNVGNAGSRERFLSYLPLSHAAERAIVEMNALYCNGIVSFSEGLDTFAAEMREVQPTFFFSVPRLWVKFKSAIDAKIPPETQEKFDDSQREGIRNQLGLAKARMVLTGSAPIPKDVQQWFIDLGVKLREGYAMTESFCDGTFWLHDGNPKAGCVGIPLPGLEVRIKEDEEICFKTPSLFKGYYKEAEKTKSVLVDGWYHTGDTGRLDKDGNLWVTGRISEVFKTSKGKFIQPIKLEDKFGSLDETEQVMICGHGLDHPLLLATLSAYGKSLSRDELKRKVESALEKINSELPPYERVSNIVFVPGEWTTESGLLTPTLKLKRKAILQEYQDVVGARHEAKVVIL